MSRTEPTTRPETPAARRMPVLPVLGLLLVAAIGARAGAADAPAPAQLHRAALAIDGDQPYALVIEGQHGVNMMGGSDDWPDIKQLRTRVKGDFLWFRADGKSWMIQDPEVVARARAAWAPVDRLGEQMDAYGREMDQHGKAMDALGKQIGETTATMQPDQTKMHAIELQMNELGRKIGDLAEQQAVATGEERERLNAQMAGLNARMGALGAQMGTVAAADSQRMTRQTMHEVSLRMNEASRPMKELGKKMKVLGQDMKRESRVADETVRALIRDAVERGLAQPAPQG